MNSHMNELVDAVEDKYIACSSRCIFLSMIDEASGLIFWTRFTGRSVDSRAVQDSFRNHHATVFMILL